MQVEENKRIQMAQIFQKEDISNFKKKYRRGNTLCSNSVSRIVLKITSLSIYTYDFQVRNFNLDIFLGLRNN